MVQVKIMVIDVLPFAYFTSSSFSYRLWYQHIRQQFQHQIYHIRQDMEKKHKLATIEFATSLKKQDFVDGIHSNREILDFVVIVEFLVQVNLQKQNVQFVYEPIGLPLF